MLKYKNLLIILSVIIISISTFYIQSALANNKLPRYTIQTIEGNEKEIEGIQLEGIDEQLRNNDWITITPNKTKYRSEESIFEQLGINTRNATITKLQKEYRSFMRGKGNWDSFFENENTLAYAEVKTKGNETERSFILNIAILDKKKKEDTSYKIELPNKNKDYYIYVQDVQIVGDELKVITTNHSNNSINIVHIYSIDLPSKSLVGDEILTGDEEYVRVISNDGSLITSAKTNSLIVQNIGTQEVQREGSTSSEEIIKNLFVYDLEKNKKSNLHLPKELKNLKSDEYRFYNDDDNIYFIGQSETGWKTIVYNFHSQKISNKYEFSSSNDWYGNNYVINKNHLYYVKNPIMEEGQKVQRPVQLYALNLTDGKVVYKGEIKASKGSKFHLQIHSINF